MLLSGPAIAGSPAPQRGTQTGLPLPRWASLKSRKANLRRGPGLRYPIAWVYRRRGYPVLILREFGNWRLLLMPDGARGWMHRALIGGSRRFVVTAPRTVLRSEAKPGAAPLARLGKGVMGTLHPCAANAVWCAVESHGFSGYVRRRDIWGSDADLLHEAAG